MDTSKDCQKWNINSLHDYLKDKIFFAQEKSDLRINAVLEEMHKIEKINDLKHESMNEIREQLNDQSKTFLKTDMYESKHEIITSKLDSLQKIVFVGLGVWLVIQGIIVVVLVFIFKK
jgi:ABC-type bacteriocin/lantibiotic exporter with double-glycine peptidase domain